MARREHSAWCGPKSIQCNRAAKMCIVHANGAGRDRRCNPVVSRDLVVDQFSDVGNPFRSFGHGVRCSDTSSEEVVLSFAHSEGR